MRAQAVLVRVQRSLIRIGTFERLADEDDIGSLRLLAAYCIKHCAGGPDAATVGLSAAASEPEPEPEGQGPCAEDCAALFGLVCTRVADLAAHFDAAGFCHGVLNTDNVLISGEAIDFGPSV